MNITMQEAKDISAWANSKNPGKWVDHCQTAARCAMEIAKHCNLDPEKAYSLGLLHDVGRYEGVRALHHVYAGYKLMKEKGYDDVAKICITHSFPIKEIRCYMGGVFDCTSEELEELEKLISTYEQDDYDKLIQLCDSLCLPEGICSMDKRLMDVVRRHGFNEFVLPKWDAYFALKDYFDKKCNKNIYDIFYDEVRRITFS